MYRRLIREARGHKSPPPVLPSILAEDFESLSGFTLTAGTITGTMTADTTNFVTGSQGLRLTNTTGGVQGSLTATKSYALAPSLDQTYSIKLYQSNPAGVQALQIFLTNSAGKVLTFQWNGTLSAGLPGWVDLTEHVRDASNGAGWGASTITSIQFKVTFNATAANGDFITLDAFRTNARGNARIMIGNDIAAATLYTVVFPFMRQRGLKMTSYVSPGFIGTATYCTLPQLQEMYAYGFDFGCHGNSDTDLTTLTEANAQSELSTASAWLIANGMPRAAYHGSLPLTHTSPTVLTAMQGAGMLTMRGTGGPIVMPTKDGVSAPLNMGGVTSNATLLSTAKASVDQICRNGGLGTIWFHDTPFGTPSNGISADKALSQIDYIHRQKLAGLCYMPTISEAYTKFGAGT